MRTDDVDNSEEFRCISLCTGYAGIELGLRRAVPALRTVCYVEIEAFACANLVAKMEAGQLDAAPIWTDIKTFDGRPFHKRVHIVTAGYPCQGESHAGKRLGKSDPRWLWPYIKRIIRCINPPYCFFENVSGHLNLGFQTVYEDLVRLGYSVEAGLFTATEVGAPHKRKRLFILAKSRGTESRRLSGCQRQENTQISSASELAHNPTGRFQAMQIQQKGKSAFRNGCGGVADADRKRPQEPKSNRLESAQSTTISRWPAHPGQPQYEWEEQRVVDVSQYRRQKHQKGQIQTGRDGAKYTDKGQAQSRLGRAANGTACRVDRLRLLGNGVVPQQAEKAFIYLMKKVTDDDKE